MAKFIEVVVVRGKDDADRMILNTARINCVHDGYDALRGVGCIINIRQGGADLNIEVEEQYEDIARRLGYKGYTLPTED